MLLLSLIGFVFRVGQNGSFALHDAAHRGHPAVVAVLLRAGADAAALDSGGRTALHRAGLGGSAAAVDVLQQAGAISTPDGDGITPLHYAARAGHAAAAARLLAGNADPAAEEHSVRLLPQLRCFLVSKGAVRARRCGAPQW